MKQMYSLDEVTILASSSPTDIYSRSIVDPYIDGKLPIFVSPMTCILNGENFNIFKHSKVTPILPRRINSEYADDNDWVAYSLDDFEKSLNYNLNYKKVLIDVANGHMKRIYDLVKIAKEKWPNVIIMIGNISNPLMYIQCCISGVDYCRAGIGGGNGCSTSVKTGIHTSLQYLLSEIKKIRESISTGIITWDKIKTVEELQEFRKQFKCYTKVIADGGIDRIDKAIKCLALGADYVMMGKTFAQCEEACGKTITVNGQRHHEYYGMASSKGQIDISGGFNKNPEGIITTVPVLYTLDEYCNDFEAALRSAMSYTGAHNLDEFRINTEVAIQSISEFKSYDK